MILTIGLGISSCGYHLQNSHSALVEKENVRKVYVRPLTNNTYKPGVENWVYNALLRHLSAHRAIRIVDRMDDADGWVSGSVDTATQAIASLTPLTATTQPNVPTISTTSPFNQIPVGTSNLATLSCTFILTKIDSITHAKKVLWSSAFARQRTFPTNNQIGVLGTTSALINESEFDRTLKDIAERMMEDVNESMLAMF